MAIKKIQISKNIRISNTEHSAIPTACSSNTHCPPSHVRATPRSAVSFPHPHHPPIRREPARDWPDPHPAAGAHPSRGPTPARRQRHFRPPHRKYGADFMTFVVLSLAGFRRCAFVLSGSGYGRFLCSGVGFFGLGNLVVRFRGVVRGREV